MSVSVANVVTEIPPFSVVEESLTTVLYENWVMGSMALDADKTYDVWASGYSCYSNLYLMDSEENILGPLYSYVDALSEIQTGPDENMDLAASWEDHTISVYGHPYGVTRNDYTGQVPHLHTGFSWITLTWDEAFNAQHLYHSTFTGHAGTLRIGWPGSWQTWLEGWDPFAPMGAGVTFRVQQRSGKIYVCNVDFENGTGVVVNGVAHG